MQNKMKNEKLTIQRAFTLVELLVVMAIIGILITIVAGNFRNSQIRGRDAQRKSDLKQLANSLEIFFSDYGQYPNSDASGEVVACPYLPQGTSSPCTWGSKEFTDNKTSYFKVVPKDPSSPRNYYYRVVPGSNNQKFQLFARLENSQDQNCIQANCTAPTVPTGVSCGTGAVANCNFAITSANTSPAEQ